MSSFGNSVATSSVPRVAVIGGGISGLSTARRLEELLPNASIDLFESSNRLGGVLQTVKRDGYLIEQSADNFLIKPTAAVDLCSKVGLASELVSTDDSRRRAFIVHGGRLVPIPEGFYLMSPRKLGPLLASPMLSLAGKLRLLLEPLVGRPFDSANSGTAEAAMLGRDESVGSFARRRLGREVFERIVQPLVAGIYTADPEQLSMAATMPQFLEYERVAGSLLRATLFRTEAVPSKNPSSTSVVDFSAQTASGARYGLFVAPKCGLSSMVGAIANRLTRTRVRLKSPVESVSKTNTGWRVEQSTPGTSQSAEFEAVVIALPAHAAANVISTLDRRLATELSSIEYAGCAVVSLGYAREQIGHKLNGFGFVVPQVENRPIIAGSFASLKFPGRAPAGHVLIRVFLGGALQSELLKSSDQELAEIAIEELSRLLAISGRPGLVDVARWPRSMPQYYVGHLAHVDRIERLMNRHTAVAIAGNAYRGVGIPQCVASGEAAAERIAAAINSGF